MKLQQRIDGTVEITSLKVDVELGNGKEIQMFKSDIRSVERFGEQYVMKVESDNYRVGNIPIEPIEESDERQVIAISEETFKLFDKATNIETTGKVIK